MGGLRSSGMVGSALGLTYWMEGRCWKMFTLESEGPGERGLVG